MGDFILGSVGVDLDIATLESKINATQSDIAIIIDGNQTTHTGGVAIGEFVLVRNSTIGGITDGLYKATAAIPANTPVTSTYLAAVDGGGLNELSGNILAPSSSIPIPASGSSSSYNVTGLTSDHELVRWNFSASADNAPPVNLTWNTYGGYFTITNSSGTTSESMRPVFALPKAVPITTHT